MKKIFVLSKQNLELSKYEVLSLQSENPSKIKYLLYDNLLVVDAGKDISERLAYTKQINTLLFVIKQNALKTAITSFDWKSVYRGNYAVKIHGDIGLSARDAGSLVWRKLELQNVRPKVNLSKPKTIIEIFKVKNKTIISLFDKEIKSDFEKRKPHMRPELAPISLHPKLARCLVNLTGVQKGVLLDTFCGTGGILIEAGLIGLTPVGYDILKKMVNISMINLKRYKIKKYTLMQKDSTKIKRKFDYIATELPYGINTKKQNLLKLYSNFLRTLKHILRKKAVLTFPNKIPINLIKKHNLKIEKTFDYYIHKNLTKKIVVIKRG